MRAGLSVRIHNVICCFQFDSSIIFLVTFEVYIFVGCISGNHERDSPVTGSFYNTSDSGGECGVPAQTLFNMPSTNRANYWLAAELSKHLKTFRKSLKVTCKTLYNRIVHIILVFQCPQRDTALTGWRCMSKRVKHL